MLTDMKIRALKPVEKPYKVRDGEGMYLLITTTGSKLWRLDYRLNGKRLTLAIGAYPAVSLSNARRHREIARANIAVGLDPTVKAPSVAETFRSVADRWFERHEAEWVTAHALRIRNRFKGDVFPFIGDVPIDSITPADVLKVIRSIEARGAIDMARRVYQTIGKVFRFAVAESLIPSDPTRDIADALSPPKPVQHHNKIPASDLPALMDRLRTLNTITSLATMFTIHTMVRTNETRFATWDEIDGDCWRIPAERMKMRRDHIVPLTPQVLVILEKLPRNSKWLFKTPGRINKPLSENAMLYGLYRLGFHGRSTVHGMRSSASTWLNEHEWNRDWIEMQLAHVDGSVRGVYNAALYLRQRREMLQAWSEYLEHPAQVPDEEELL